MKKLSNFIIDENITFKNLLNPRFVFLLLHKYKYIYYLLIGISGILISLLITWYLSEFVFGVENYFFAFLIGYFVNLVYNFLLNLKVVFVNKSMKFKLFFNYFIFSLINLLVQSILIKILIFIIGISFYLIIICLVSFLTSIIGFIFLKTKLFK